MTATQWARIGGTVLTGVVGVALGGPVGLAAAPLGGEVAAQVTGAVTGEPVEAGAGLFGAGTLEAPSRTSPSPSGTLEAAVRPQSAAAVEADGYTPWVKDAWTRRDATGRVVMVGFTEFGTFYEVRLP